MRLIKAAAMVALAGLLGVAGWAAYHGGWPPWLSPRAPTPSAENTEPPVAEYREVHSGPAGETGSVLTIDRAGSAPVTRPSLMSVRSSSSRSGITTCRGSSVPAAAPGSSGV